MSENDQPPAPATAPPRWHAQPPPAAPEASQPDTEAGPGTDAAPPVPEAGPDPDALGETVDGELEDAETVDGGTDPDRATAPSGDAPAAEPVPDEQAADEQAADGQAAEESPAADPGTAEEVPEAPAGGWAPQTPDAPNPAPAEPDPPAPAPAPEGEERGPRLSKDAQAALEVITAMANAMQAEAAGTREQLARLATTIEESARLRGRDQEHVDALHSDNTRLRAGELTAALAPLLTGLVRLADSMASMAAGDRNSIAGMLRVQLLQTLDVTANVTEFAPEAGAEFDTKRMTGAGREETTDADRNGRVARTLRSGFIRGEYVVRPAEVVVWRLASTTSPAGAGTEQ